MRWGFGWPMGPFETWQAVGWQLMAKWIEEDRKAHKTLAPPPLPEWVGTISGAYCVKGSYAPSAHKHKARSELPLYRHQLSLPATAVESATVPGKTVFAGRTDIRLWHDGDSHIAILSCPIADQSVTATTLNEMREAIGIAEQKFRALILWNPPPLSPLRRHCEKSGDTRQTWLNRLRQMEQQVSERQHIHQLLRYLAIPVIGTAQGYVSQCGCELLLHCDRVVAAIECQLGFPNLARGLFPAHGGCTEMVRRGEQHGSQCDIFSLIKFSFDTLMNSHTAANAHQARDRGLLTATDVVVFNPDELLSCAKVHAQCLIQTGYRPPVRRPVAVAGRAAADALINTMNAADQRFNGNTGGQEQNDKIAEKLAYVLCGGDAASHQYVDPDHLLHLEREAFSAIVRLLNK
jgi:3-hydroxyacyl-CoA dehydrogenase